MQIKQKQVKDVGSCNYCTRGALKGDGKSMVYPYDTVFEIRGEVGPVSLICGECLLSLVKAISLLSKHEF